MINTITGNLSNCMTVGFIFSYSFHRLVLMNGLQEFYGWLVAWGTCSRVT